MRLAVEHHERFVLERWVLRPGGGLGPIPALVSRPAGDGKAPAILYCHAHGNRHAIGKDELVAGRPALLRPYAEDLARAGFAALCIDLPCFGERIEPGESALSKALLWRGETLFGRMIAELRAALGWLAGRSDIDSARLGTLGLSMGATLSWWVAALDRRVAAVAELCCLADLATLVASGAHDLHGPYMTVPGLLREFQTADIAGLIAPRPHLACVGLADPLTPPAAVAVVDAALAARYRACGAPEAWSLRREPASGHVETPGMRAAVLAFLNRHLGAASTASGR
ncbi:MAG: dienelactone hydrolase family protein [Alphaproteobacteria bacterium]|nr:dienelactone hydrolase family protein [Alphaproteobacteria bacterium]